MVGNESVIETEYKLLVPVTVLITFIKLLIVGAMIRFYCKMG